jgi:hypothetical protein
MTNYQVIEAAITKAKTLAMAHGLEFISQDEVGEYENCCELKMVVLTMWICILEDYSCQNFDSDGNPITPNYECITISQVLELVAKINKLSCP